MGLMGKSAARASEMFFLYFIFKVGKVDVIKFERMKAKDTAQYF